MLKQITSVPVLTCRSYLTARCLSTGAKAGSESGAPKSKSKSAKAETATVTGKTPASSKSSEPSNTSEQLPPNQPAGNVYKAPEYYQHNVDTYADLMVEMASKRLPRPQRPGGN